MNLNPADVLNPVFHFLNGSSRTTELYLHGDRLVLAAAHRVDIERGILAKTNTASHFQFETIATGISAADYFG
jgi:hypothetical protein